MVALSPFFLPVEITEYNLKKLYAPSVVLKQPETFCFTFIILTSCSAWLFPKGTIKLRAKWRTSSLYFISLSRDSPQVHTSTVWVIVLLTGKLSFRPFPICPFCAPAFFYDFVLLLFGCGLLYPSDEGGLELLVLFRPNLFFSSWFSN